MIARTTQALCYWMKYKQQIFSSYHFSEGAITSELYILFQTFKKGNFLVLPEYPYKKIPGNTYNKESRERVDILLLFYKKKRKFISDKDNDVQIIDSDILFLFEIKKMESTNDINSDFRKLKDGLNENSNIKKYIIFVNQESVKLKFDKVANRAIKRKEIKPWKLSIERFVAKHAKGYKHRIINIKAASGLNGIRRDSSFSILVEVL